jgi:hypothetical protein
MEKTSKIREVDCFRNEISESIQKLKNFWCEETGGVLQCPQLK